MVLTLPVLASMVGASHQACAFAGHVKVGGQPTGEECFPCGCSHSNCACDEGEQAGPCPPEGPLAAQSGDGGAGVLLVLAGVAFTLRMKRRR
jgi:hypothetical protein